MAETIQDWIISLKYQVDEQSARRVEDIARRLRAGQEVTSQEMREFEKGMKGLARTHETSMRQMSQSAQQHGQKFSTVVNQVIHPSITKITAALGALSTAVGGFKAFEGVVKNLQQVGDLSRDLNVTALSLNALDRSLRNIGAGSGAATSLVTTMQDAVQRNRGNIVLLQGMGVTAKDSAERVIELSRFVKREAAANRFDIAVQRLAEIGYSIADARRMLALSEEDYRRQQGIRRRWKLDSADDIRTAQKLRSEWEDVMSNMEGVQSAIFVPMMTSITKIIGKVNKLIEGHEGEIRAFFTAIVEPIGQWAEGKADDMIAYMEKLIGPKGAEERAAWVKWWGDVKKGVDGAFDGVVRVATAINTVASAIVALNDAYQNSPLSKPIFTVPDLEKDKKLPWWKRFLPSSLRPSEADPEQNPSAPPEVPTSAPPATTESYQRWRNRPTMGGASYPGIAPGAAPGISQQQQAPIGGQQQFREQQEEIRVTKDNTEEVKKNTQELQEQRRSRGFFGSAWDRIKNLVGAGGTEGAGEGGPPDISGRGGAGGGAGAGAGGEAGPGGRVDRGGFESNAPGGSSRGRDRGGFEPNPSGSEIEAKNITGGMGINRAQWNAYIRGVIGKESGGRYGIMGGSAKRVPGGRFAGRYQMGGQEIIAAAKALGETPPIRYVNGVAIGSKEFLNDKAMQDRYFESFTLANHKTLMATSPQYRALSREKQLQVLGYAHNQGPRGAANYLRTGRVGSDAFGTKGSSYMAPIARELAKIGSSPTASEVGGAIRDQHGAGHLDSKGADPRIAELVGAGAAALPPGYTVRTTPHGGLRPNQKYGFHPKGMANDFEIVDPQGKAIPNRGGDPTGMYTRLARAAYAEQLNRYPELTGKFAWGGAFGTVPGGKVQDLMHFDIGGERGHILQNRLSNLGPLEGFGGNRPLGDNAPPIATPSNVANDNSRSVSQHNEYKTTINAEDAKGAASIFKGAAENINRINMSQIKGVIR